MLLISSPIPIPSILITPPSPEKSRPGPCPPFSLPRLAVEDDGYRANRLSLPPSGRWPPWHSSSAVRPSDEGLSPDQFRLLLKASRDQRAKTQSQKAPDLLKQSVLKNQCLKQLERRARFLSKVNGPSCTAALSIAEVPLEVPTTIHRTISSCRFGSEHATPQTAEDSLQDLAIVSPSTTSGVEDTLPIAKQPLASSKFSPAMSNKSRYITPSLDEITARLKPAHVPSNRDCTRSRLPDFLKASRLSPGSTDDRTKTLPVHSLTPNHEIFDTTFVQQVIRPQRPYPYTFVLGLRRTFIPHSVDVMAGLIHVNRADTARDMILTLRRRSSPPPGLCHPPAEFQYSRRVGCEVGF